MRLTANDPIDWIFYELRGPATAHGSWSQTTLEYSPWAEGVEARLTDGRMTYERDPGTVERWYYAHPTFLRDGVDGEQAAAQAREGAAALTAALDRAIE